MFLLIFIPCIISKISMLVKDYFRHVVRKMKLFYPTGSPPTPYLRIPKEKQFFTYSKKCDKIYHKLIDNKVNRLFLQSQDWSLNWRYLCTAFGIKGEGGMPKSSNLTDNLQSLLNHFNYVLISTIQWPDKLNNNITTYSVFKYFSQTSF